MSKVETSKVENLTARRVREQEAEREANRDQLTYGLESLLVDLATNKWVNDLKPQDLKPEVTTVLAGMLLGYVERAKNLHTQMVALAASLGGTRK
jgi:hypothetical protein